MKNIKHLFWRAGFGLSQRAWEQYKNQPLSYALEDLFVQEDTTDLFPTSLIQADLLERMDKQKRKAFLEVEKNKLIQTIADWIAQMADDNANPLLERMSLFWHGHFACTTKLGTLAQNQLNVIRKNALGNFRDLVVGIAKDPSMIRFLNNQQNRKKQPNENFARELLELFTIGRGNYSERDIKEAARAFTGWSSNKAGQFVFRKPFHDYGTKTFFGKTGTFDGTDIIDIILEEKATAKFIVRKIYQYFVNEQTQEEHIEYLSNLFYESDYNIKVVMRAIFESDWFYDDNNIGSKIKSPVDLLVGMMRSINVKFPNPKSSIFALKALGQVPFQPPNVAGWPGGQSWIDNASLMLRLNLPFFLMNAAEVNIKAKDDLKAKVRGKGLKKLDAVVDLKPLESYYQGVELEELKLSIQEWLLNVDIPNGNNQQEHFIGKMNAPSNLQSIITLTMAQPAYQLC